MAQTLSPARSQPPAARATLRRLLRSALFITGTVYIVFTLMLVLLQSRLVYFPTAELDATPARIGLAYDDVWLRTDDGLRLHGWWVPAAEERGTLLFFHGNAGNISHRLLSLESFQRLGYSTFIVDYRGYGQSEGRPSEAGTYLDAEAAWRHLVTDRGIPPERIALFGRSLGGAVAAALAVRERPAAVILESTFTSVPDLGAELYPFLPVRWLARIRYDTLARVPHITAPLLVVHGRDDEIIRFAHGRRIWEAASEPKAFLELTGGHNEGFVITGERYERGIAEFLERSGL